MHRRQRHRPVHQRGPWLRRVGCAGVLLGVVVVGVRRPPPPIDVDSFTAAQDRRMCILIDSFLAVATVGVSPPPDATAEEFQAATRINAQLAQMSETLRGSVREMGC